MDSILHHSLLKEILCQIFSKYLSLQDISYFDIAICNNKKRNGYLEVIGSVACIWRADRGRQFTSDGISYLSNRNIKVRYLGACGVVNNDTAMKIAGFGAYFIGLDINNNAVSHINMIAIAEGCRNIKTLNISQCCNLTEIRLAKIAEYCYNLTDLNASDCRITEIGIIKLAEFCHNIEVLDIRGCVEVTDRSMIRLAEGCPNITRLDTSFCDGNTDMSISKLLECCFSIRFLCIINSNITDASMIMLAEYCHNIGSLILLGHTMRGILIKVDTNDSGNKSLSMRVPREMTDTTVIDIAELLEQVV
jgi:hypothetical protein